MNACLDTTQRPQALEAATQVDWDLLIIGGGITGAGIALDAADRGLKTLLVEMDDFASGTSSRSTKLIHGGLRYLKQFEFRLVSEVGKERAILHHNAPHIVLPEKMLLPVVKGGSLGWTGVKFGLWLYDRLAGVKPEERRKMLSKDDVAAMEPVLQPSGILGAGLYSEYRTDDARLTIEIVKTAVQHGAACFNHLRATALLKENGKLAGVECEDLLSGQRKVFRSKRVVNAAGPWVDSIRKEDGSLQGKRLHHTKGVHLVLPHDKLPLHHSVYFDIPDGRMMFAIPRHPWTYIGTTDTDFDGDMQHPRVTKKDAEYLLAASNRYFPGCDLKIEDVVSSWAGIRPLIHEEGKSASQLSRKDEVFVSDSGLITIAGGKLTGYRIMAQKIVDMVQDQLFHSGWIKKKSRCRTKDILLCGGEMDGMQAVKFREWSLAFRLSEKEIVWLAGLFGSNTGRILKSLPANPTKTDLVLAALDYCIKEEAVASMADFFVRRTALLYFGRPWISPVKEDVRIAMENILRPLGIDPDAEDVDRLYADAVDFC